MLNLNIAQIIQKAFLPRDGRFSKPLSDAILLFLARVMKMMKPDGGSRL